VSTKNLGGHDNPYPYAVCQDDLASRLQRLDEREDIQLFVKLPRWLEIDTPVGKYNPDWAILRFSSTTVTRYTSRGKRKEPATS
jgi:restriction endonuclease